MDCNRIWLNGLKVSLRILVLGFAAGAIAGGCAATTSAPFGEGADRYRFEIALERARGETGSCTGRVSVTDRASKRRIVIPAFSAPWGGTTTTSMADTTYGATLTATLTMAPDGASGTCRAVLRRGERLIASRKATIPVKVTATAPNIRY